MRRDGRKLHRRGYYVSDEDDRFVKQRALDLRIPGGASAVVREAIALLRKLSDTQERERT